MKLWLFDKIAFYADQIADLVSRPWLRLARWAADRWREEKGWQ